METISHQDSNELKLPYLPHELIVQILLELPVKSLLRFRSVSKSWLSLVSSPQFIETHLAKSSNDDEFTHHRILFCAYNNSSFDLKYCTLQSALLNVSPVTDRVDLHMDFARNPAESIILIGSCNGLICIGIDKIDRDEVFLWNPSTRKTKRLPYPSFKFIWCARYGFVYDKLNDDYKVVGIFTADDFPTRVEVYSRKKDSWRSIKDNKYGVPRRQSGNIALANGKLHWIARVSTNENNKIVSFDLANETFGEVEWPVSYSSGWSLGVLGGCLSLVHNDHKTGVDVWIMRDYGVRQSWTNMGRIPFTDPAEWYICSTPVFLLKTGKIGLKFRSSIIFYDPKKADIYVESLVLP